MSWFISAVIRSFLPSICIIFYSYSRIGTDENNMKIKIWTVLLTTIRKARNYVDYCQDEDICQYHLNWIDHCRDVDHCQYHLNWIDHCQDVDHCQYHLNWIDHCQDVDHCQYHLGIDHCHCQDVCRPLSVPP